MTHDPDKKPEPGPFRGDRAEWRASMDALDDGSLLTLEPDDPLALEILAHWDELEEP